MNGFPKKETSLKCCVGTHEKVTVVGCVGEFRDTSLMAERLVVISETTPRLDTRSG